MDASAITTLTAHLEMLVEEMIKIQRGAQKELKLAYQRRIDAVIAERAKKIEENAEELAQEMLKQTVKATRWRREVNIAALHEASSQGGETVDVSSLAEKLEKLVSEERAMSDALRREKRDRTDMDVYTVEVAFRTFLEKSMLDYLRLYSAQEDERRNVVELEIKYQDRVCQLVAAEDEKYFSLKVASIKPCEEHQAVLVHEEMKKRENLLTKQYAKAREAFQKFNEDHLVRSAYMLSIVQKACNKCITAGTLMVEECRCGEEESDLTSDEEETSSADDSEGSVMDE